MDPGELEILADEVLFRIRRRPGRPVSLRSLARQFRVDIDDLTAAARRLREWGYKTKITGDRQITFLAAPDILTATEIGYELKTRFMGKTVYSYQRVRSTNDLAARLAELGVHEGTIVTAEEQTEGRGRLGRSWHSPAGTGIYLSIILRPTFKPELAPGVSITTALALADTVSEYCPGNVQIKWPNDLLISGRKAAGILTELAAEKNKIDHLIVGVGINVNHKAEDFPDDLRNIATSIRRVIRRNVSRVSLLKRFLVNFEREYTRYRKDQLTKSHRRVRKYSSLLGSSVRLSTGKSTIEGVAVDIDRHGALVIEKDGRTVRVTSGEVTVVKSSL